MDQEEKRIPQWKIRQDTIQDFESKPVELDNFKNIISKMSEEDMKVYEESLKILNESTSQIIKSLEEHAKNPESSMELIKNFNDALRGKNVK